MSDQRYIKEGWLMKRSRSGRVVSNWRRRYFRLTRTELLYYKTPQDIAPRRCYELTLDTSVLRTNDQGYPLCILFQPAPGQPSFYMQAENEVEKDEWITAIYNAYRRTPDVAQQTLAPEMPKAEPAASIGPTPPQPPAAPAQPSRILLKLVVEEARKLKAADFNGKSDPYCVVKLVGKDGQIIDVEEKRTEVIPATLEPTWRKPFEIGRVVDLNSVKAIRFDLFDHDTFKRHDSLGSVQVPFSRFRMSPASTAQSEPIDDWFRVEPPKKTGLSSSPRRNDSREKEHVVKDWGELRVQMSISGPNLVDFFHSSDLAFVPTSPVATASNEHTDNRLEVTVIAARDLISADLNNSSDPYCELSLLDDHGKAIPGEYATTAIMHRTRNPAWADEHHVFGLICHIEKAASLKVRLVDYDKSNRNDPLGCVHVGLDQLSAHKWTEWHVLQPEEGMSVRENLGAIQLKIWLIGERRGEHARQLKIEKELNTKRHNISVEQLELENAQFQLHDAACKLDGARIPCAVTDYQSRDPRFYGINGCIHYLNSQIPRAHQEKVSTDEGFQARAGLEGQAVLEVTVIEASDLKQKQKQGGDTGTPATPYAVIEIDPSVCVEECKRTSAPLSPQKSKRIAAAASEARNTMFSKRSQAEVSLHRSKLVKNEMRSEKSLEVNPDKPVLKVEILTGHGLSPADMNGYSDPYCTLSITDRTGKAIDAEKKRTAVVSKTLNPVWTNENFLFGNSVPLSDAKSLLIHVKDHNNIGRSTPLGRVEVPLYDLCRASAGFTSISSKTVMKRYELKPEPWMKKHAKDLGELCIKTEVVGDATALAELMQRVSTVPMDKSLSILTFSEANIQSEASMDMDMSATNIGGSELEDETTEVIQRGLPIQTSTSRVLGTTATWRKEKFALSLSYPGVFSDAKYPSSETHVLHLRVHEARNLLLTETAGSPANIGSSSLELDAVHDSPTSGISRNAERAQDATNIYFTIIPVLGDGRLEDAERKQSLTVYNARDPSWPEENFVFGKIKDIANVSYLSLHLYGRDLQHDQKEVLSKLLNHEEKKQDSRLKRFQLHKLTPSGEIDDDGFEILQYGQRVLAFRGGDNGGRFYPARVQKYIPFPGDVYDVYFEDAIETIDELRNLISFDVKGAVQAVRSDGRVDVSVENELPAIANSARRTLRYTVKPTQLIPMNSLTDKVEMMMARRFDMEKEENQRWLKLQHKFSGIVIDVLSASDLLVPVNEGGKPQKFKQLDKTSKPTCRITLLGNPKQVASSSCRFNKQGELIPSDTVTLSNWNCQKGEALAATVLHGSAETEDVHLFQQKPLVMGRVDTTPPGDTDYQPVEQHEIKMGYQILEQASSILIRVDNEDGAVNQTVGFVKIDLAMLQSGQQDLNLQIVPPDTTNVPYYKFVGSLFLRITTWSDTFKPRLIKASIKAGDFKPRVSVCGLSMWYQRQLKIETQSASILTRGVTWIERRQILRSSLTPTENCQIDELHAVLVVIMKRIVGILREIRQFEEFEMLSADDMRKCRHIHTVNADPASEWLGCTMDKLSLEARKEVVAGLENELLDLAGVTGPRIFPDADIPREEWVKLRADRQRLLRESGSFFMRDQTSALVLSVPRSFTGEGMISWILRHPPVLWEDGWTKYCRGSALESSCRLGWSNANLEFDPDAIQAPTTHEYALQWLSALCAAGFVENVTPGIAAVTDLGKRHVLLEYKVDRFYRLREVDMWIEKLSREKSLYPLDLVQEIDCYQASDLPVFSRSVNESTDNSSSEQEQISNKRSKTYAKKLTEHCDGFLGMHTLGSSALFSPDIRKNSFLHPVAETIAEKAEEYAENVLWDWKYCLFIPSRKHLYMYEQETSTTPVAFIDMASATCKVAYNFTNDAKGGWMDIVNPTVCVRKPDSQDFVSISAESLDKMTRTRDKGDKVIEVKTAHTQKWIQALTSSGVCVEMRPGQMVLMKRLNPTILQQKCIKHATEFDHNDLEGSFNRLLNCVFGHDKELSHQDHEKKSRELRAQVRRELKKPGSMGETVMAYYGKGKNLKSKPMHSGSFKKDSLYSGRIVRIRTPFTNPAYQFTVKYDISNKTEVPESLSHLLVKYKVTDKASWLGLPKAQRDMFLLYDVEYSHDNERIVEEGLMREHIRTSEGDLDPHKVSDRCTDLNILFKATDLENCVSRMVKHRYRHKPLGVLKIPIRMISPHRTVDAWYPLAPASDMLQKTRLGQIRVELKLVHKRDVKRSAKVPSLIEAIKSEVSVSTLPTQEKNLTPKGNAERDSKKKIPFVVGLEPSFVKVSILEGRSLRVADLFTSDPFVEIVLIDKDSKERDTSLKTDIKMKTLNPKWENQEFLLGKTEKTMLRDKKALLLRVMDFDQTSANDPLGCVTIEFQRSETGYIRGVVLKQADALGGTIMQELTLDEYGRVEVEAMLLPASGQSKPKSKKTPAPDGLLGKLRFLVDIMRNENYVDPNAKQLDTTYSAEMAIKDVDLKNENWDEYTCYFQPHGEGGLRIQYDPASEDLGVGNPYKFSELLRQAAPLLNSDTAKIGKSLQTSSFSVGGAYSILGRTYDLSKVDYFDVRLVSESQGRVYEGQLGKLDRKMERKSGSKAEDGKTKFSLKKPEQCANFRDEMLVLTDRDSKQKATLTFDLNLIGILRADRVRRILADTFRLVGLVFDSRTLNQNSGRYDPERLQKDVHTFLWDTCRTNVFPGRNVGDELLAQVRIMRHASKLHWKVTPQLLAYVFEIVFVSGEKDRLSYENAVAVDAVLNRWSRILTQVTEAKDYLTGHLHGKKTPRLIEALFTECEWTGFDFSSLSGSLTSSGGDSVGAGRNCEERSSPLHVGDRVTAQLPLLKHAGVPVDVELPGGQFVAAIIAKESGDGTYDIKLCTGFGMGETVLVCLLHGDNDPEVSNRRVRDIKQARLAQLKQYDEKEHPESPCLVEYVDNLQPREEWQPRDSIEATLLQVDGGILKGQLQKEDYVRVNGGAVISAENNRDRRDLTKIDYGHADPTPQKTSTMTGSTRPARVSHNYGNARYDIVYLDGQQPKDEKLVTRERLLPVTDGIMYDGRVTSAYLPPNRMDDFPSTAKYSILLESGELVNNLERSQLRSRQKFIAADTALLGSVFSSTLQTLDKTGTQPSSSTMNMADKLNNLWWGSDKIVKVYAMLPSAVKTIQARDATTNKLLQSALMERSEDQPRFLGQYHGFVKGDNFDKAEEEKLELVYTAACKRRTHSTLSNGTIAFSKKNCFYLIVAPPPLVQVRGAVTVRSHSASGPLFKALVLATLGKTSGSVVSILQRLLRAECNIDPRLHRKGRTVMIEAVKVDLNTTPSRCVVLNMMPSPSDGTLVGDNNADLTGVVLSNATIEIKFRLSMPHNDHGNISDAMDVSFAQATGISERLKLKKTLTVEGDKSSVDFGNLDKLPWILATSEEMIAPSMALSIDFTSAEGRFDSEPEVSLELEPLDDIRVSVRDFDENVHELHFPMYDVLAEARVRRELSPFHKANIAPGPFATSHCNLQFQKSSANKSPNAATVKVPRADIKFDKLSVQVLEASNMTLKEKMGTDGLLVEVLLVSSDFRQHMASDKKITTPFGLALSSTGEILPDADKQIYQKNSVFLLTNDKTAPATTLSTPLTTSVAWKNKYALQPDNQLKFTYPAIDLDRVSDVKMIVRDKKTNTKIGIVTIPMAKIGVSRSTNNADKPKDEPIFSVHHEGSDRKRVVGTISLSITRMKSYGEKTEVYAKQLEKNMDFWAICPKELLKMTLDQHENKLSRSFLATGPPVSGGGKILLEKSLEMELQLQKITKVRLIFDAMNKLHATSLAESSTAIVSTTNAPSRISTDLTSLAFDQLRLTLQQTKSLVRDTAQELGLIDRRLPWSSDAHGDENESGLCDNMVIVEANVATCTHRVRHTVLKLYEVFIVHFMPKLNELYVLDAKEDRVDVATGEKLLSFFNNEVDELELEDQKVRQRLYQRLRLAKLTQVLDMIMRATVRVKVMDEDRNNVDNYLGTACIPLMDLLDQQPRDDMYQLLYLPTTNLRGYRIATQSPGEHDRGKVRLRLHLKVSESSFFEQAINVYKIWKAKYLAQHEAARRRLHAAVVPAQRRRWLTIKGYLDELTKQAKGKLHWERTPVLLSLVWDIFALQESSPTHVKKKAIDAEELEYTQSVAQVANAYRESVMKVHKRWVNMQPTLEELMTIQAAALIHAQRTPELLDDIEREIEGLDVGLSTAWQQVKQKWQILLNALEELVSMQERKLNLTRAPQLLKIVEQRCSKGLSSRHADAVSNIQSRWMGITQPNGPLSELRLMEKKGLHWRRTHELLLLLGEQCEGFADVDARALDTVQNRWEQVQEWLHEIVEMQQQHSIDCEHTPFILEKMHLWRSMRVNRQGELNKPEKLFNPIRAAPPSPKNKDDAGGRPRSLSHQNSSSRVSSDGSIRSDSSADDNGQLEGMAEWYAIEEAKYELERIPYHRITVDTEKRNWLSYSRDGKDIRLLITQQEMVFTPANVRLALEDRGVIPKTSSFDPTAERNATNKDSDDAWISPSLADPKSGSQSVALPKTVLKEIEELEKMLEKHRDDSQQVFALPNPERVAELYQSMKSLGKSDLLWKVDHAVSRNRELAVPENYQLLLKEMTLRQIPTTEVENLVKSLAFTLQKEVLVAKGIAVPTTANPTTLLQLMHRHQVKEVLLPPDTTAILTLLQERGMDRKGDPVILRGIRIGTQSTGAASDNTSGASSSKSLNTGLGIIDTQIEILRKTLLFEALRKRNSLVRTFAVESHVLDDEDERTEADMFAAAVENAEIDVSGDYMTLVERFQRLLVHEAYTKRLAEYAALDRCVQALLGKSRDETVTKEEIAMELHNINKRVIGANYRLPAEAFTKEELKQAVRAGRIRTPSDEMLARCPQGNNARAMAHYAAISYAANVFQEVTSFRSRVDLGKNRLQDTFPFDECSSVDGVAIPKQWSRWTFSQSIADWLLGFDTSTLSIKRKLSAAHRQRLEWASAAFTLRNRWLQRGLGWCDPAFGEGVGVKILLDRLLLFEAANKMDMVKTEKLLREVRDKCSRLREREQEAQAKLEERYQSNLELLEKLVTHAERCMNNRKLHSEETPVLLHKLEQVCVVPNGLNERHREAYHKVATHWLPQQQHLTELVKMHREGTFSITRTPELLGKMNYHTEGKAGSEELSEDMVAASAQRVAPELQATFVDRKLNEVRLGQRKEASSLHLDLNTDDDIANQSVDDTTWKELSHSKRVAQPLSPHEKHTSWKVVRNAVAANAAFATAASSSDKAEKFKVAIEPKSATKLVSPRRKLSLSEELKELLRSPSQWLTGAGPQEESIKPELYFPKEVVLETPSASLTGAAK